MRHQKLNRLMNLCTDITNITNLDLLTEQQCIALAEQGYCPDILIEHPSPVVTRAIAKGIRARSHKLNQQQYGENYTFNTSQYFLVPEEDRAIERMFKKLISPEGHPKLSMLLERPLFDHQRHIFLLNQYLFSRILDSELITLLIRNASIINPKFALIQSSEVVLAMIDHGYLQESYFELAEHDPVIRSAISHKDKTGRFAGDDNPNIRKNVLECCQDCHLFVNDSSLLVLSSIIENSVNWKQLDVLEYLINKHITQKSPQSYQFQELLLAILDLRIFTIPELHKIVGSVLVRSRYKDIKTKAKELRLKARFVTEGNFRT